MTQVGKFSSVFGTSKDKRNQETTCPLHTGYLTRLQESL